MDLSALIERVATSLSPDRPLPSYRLQWIYEDIEALKALGCLRDPKEPTLEHIRAALTDAIEAERRHTVGPGHRSAITAFEYALGLCDYRRFEPGDYIVPLSWRAGPALMVVRADDRYAYAVNPNLAGIAQLQVVSIPHLGARRAEPHEVTGLAPGSVVPTEKP